MAAAAPRFRTARTARSLWALSMTLIAASFIFRTWNTPGVIESLGVTGWDLFFEITWWSVLIPAAAPAYAIMGLLIATRKPSNPIGWLALALSILIVLQDMAWQYSVRAGAVSPGVWPGEGFAAWMTGWFAILMFPPFPFTLILLYFPAGQLVSPRWRWVARLAIASVLLGTAIAVVQPPVMFGEQEAAMAQPWASLSLRLSGIGSIASLLGAALSVALRYRRAETHEQHQVKWLAYISMIIGLSMALGILAWSINGMYYLGSGILSFAVLGMTVGIPATIAIAMLKHRLYEIDFIINRTLVYGAVTAVLLGVYATTVLALQSTLRHLIGHQSSLAVVTSTIAIVALFAPLRDRIQGLVDQRFYRSKYDAEKTLTAFSRRLRNEVDLDRLTAGLMAVVDEAVHPTQVSLWMVKRPSRMTRANREQG